MLSCVMLTRMKAARQVGKHLRSGPDHYEGVAMPELTCSTDNCDSPASVKGMCKKHYNLDYRAKQSKPCLVSGCSKVARTRGRCQPHDRAWRVESGLVEECSVDGCVKPITAKGYCATHYGRWRKSGDPGGLDSLRDLYVGKTCAGPECDRPVYAKGLCNAHRAQEKRGKPLTPIMVRATSAGTIEERLSARTGAADENGCLPWTGPFDTSGYPILRPSWRGSKSAHRIAYMAHFDTTVPGHIPIHHKCGNRICVEPSHLQEVTPIENTAEMLERRYYVERIEMLESALRELDEEHPVLAVPGVG